MHDRYAAYGLQLRSDFPLRGMTSELGDGLPSLQLELITPHELDSKWSAVEQPPLWSGRLGDGSELTIERGRRGETLFANGEIARYQLDPGGRRLACAPAEPGWAWQRTLLGKVLSSIGVMRGYEALHASAVDSPSGAVAIAAPTGTGKTTLALELMRRGWPLIADDVLALAPSPSGPVAYPGTPHMNLSLLSASPPPREVARTIALLDGDRWLVARRTAREPRPLRTVCLFARAPGLTLDVQRLPRSPLPLTPYMLGLQGDGERARRRFGIYADIADAAKLVRLTGPETARPSALADLVEHAVCGEPAAVPAGAER